jgi:hypothetical protein
MDRIVWLGHLYFPYLVDGKHVFELKAESARRTKVVNKESFRGVLVPFLWPIFIDNYMRAGFHDLNQGLKRYLESR